MADELIDWRVRWNSSRTWRTQAFRLYVHFKTGRCLPICLPIWPDLELSERCPECRAQHEQECKFREVLAALDGGGA